jgi:hypothetical protein
MKNAREKFISSIKEVDKMSETNNSVKRANMTHILCSESKIVCEIFDKFRFGYMSFEWFIRSFTKIESDLIVEEDSTFDRYQFLESEVVVISDCGVSLIVASNIALLGLYDSFILAMSLKEQSKYDTLLMQHFRDYPLVPKQAFNW